MIRRNFLKGIVLVASQGALSSCARRDAKMDITGAAISLLRQVPPDSWKRLATKKIYLAHQSVGFDIIAGIEDLRKRSPVIELRIRETRNTSDFDGPVLAHSKNGKNGFPATKIAGFAEFMDQVGDKVDWAGFKMCYVDFKPDTGVQAVFEEYRTAMARLRTTHSRTTFLHLTAPLVLLPSGPRVWAKRLLGRPNNPLLSNIRRNEFNQTLLGEFRGKEPVFDLADTESRLPDGSRTEFSSGGKTYVALADAYSDNAGHLNEPGRQWVAAHFLKFLAQVAS